MHTCSTKWLGVIQGRLLAKYKGRYQAHPVGYWQDEFALAKNCGLNCIEFILDFENYELNPLLTSSGREEIKHLVKSTGVHVNSICADYFMEAPIHSSNEKSADKSILVLTLLLESAVALGVSDIVLPCVDQSSLSHEKDSMVRFINRVRSVMPLFEKKNVNLSLETDLDPQTFLSVLKQINSKNIKVNYDIGNSAALGFEPTEELACYGKYISDIHIKDRMLDGGPVVLGEGSAQFKLFFEALRKLNYQGSFIMQAYRDDEGLGIFKQQLSWIKAYLDTYYE